MEPVKNQFGEFVAKWENNFHPDNANFMQRVFWMAVYKPEGRYSIGYRLDLGKNIKIVERGEGTLEDFKKVLNNQTK